MKRKISHWNNNPQLVKASQILILVVMVLLFFVFVTFLQTDYNLVSPLIPDYVVFDVLRPYTYSGFVLTIILMFSYISQLYKQYFISVLISMMGVLCHTIFISM